MLIVKNRTPCVGIDIPRHSPAPVLYAAEQMQKYIEAKSSCALPMTPVGNKAIVLRINATADQFKSDTPADSYAIDCDNQNIYLTGFDAAGLVYAAFDFLQTELDIGFAGLGDDGVRNAYAPTLEVNVASRVKSPDLSYRGFQSACIEDLIEYSGGISSLHTLRLDWMAQNGMNYVVLHPADHWENIKLLLPEVKRRGLKVQYGHHSWSHWVSADKYFEDHPEYFAMKDGERIRNPKDMQLNLCTSNPRVAEVMADEIIALLNRHPDVDAISLWPEDGTGMCECDACTEMNRLPSGWKFDLIPQNDEILPVMQSDVCRYLNAQDNAPEAYRHIPRSYRQPDKTRRYALFVNAVAKIVGKSHPDTILSTLFYHDIDEPPEGIEFESNVQITLAHYWRCSRHQIYDPDCPENAYYWRITKQWQELCSGQIVIYDYLMGMSSLMSMPWPIIPTMHRDWQAMKAMGILGATIQSQASHFTVYGPTYAAFAKMAWNIDAATESLSESYYFDMYEEASVPLIEAARLMEHRLASNEFDSSDKKFIDEAIFSCFKLHSDKYQTLFEHCVYPSINYFARIMDEDSINRMLDLVSEADAQACQSRTRNNMRKYSSAANYWVQVYLLCSKLTVLAKASHATPQVFDTMLLDDIVKQYESILYYVDKLESGVVAKGMLLDRTWNVSWSRRYERFLNFYRDPESGTSSEVMPFWP